VIAAALAVLAAATSPTAVGVGAHEYRFGVYRSSVRPGAVVFNLHDFGEDAHDLVVLGPRGYRSAVSPDVRPGQDVAFRVHLRRAGVYRLICVKPGHAARGMRATLRVR
jgi:plastocyanin